jgi:hypothetical protein
MTNWDALKAWKDAPTTAERKPAEIEQAMTECWDTKHPEGIDGKFMIFKVETGKVFSKLVTRQEREQWLSRDE